MVTRIARVWINRVRLPLENRMTGRFHTYPLIGVNIKLCLIIGVLFSLYTLLYIIDFLNRNSNN